MFAFDITCLLLMQLPVLTSYRWCTSLHLGCLVPQLLAGRLVGSSVEDLARFPWPEFGRCGLKFQRPGETAKGPVAYPVETGASCSELIGDYSSLTYVFGTMTCVERQPADVRP